MTACNIDGDKHQAADQGEDEEDIPEHTQEAQEDDGIEADLVNEVVFADAQGDGPSEERGAEERRRVPFVGIFGARGVNGRNAGS